MTDDTTQQDSGDGKRWDMDATLRHIPRVLVIEDTVEIGEIIKATLERLDVITFIETHGVDALELYDRIHPDIVLLDIGLPDMNGWKVLDAIKERKKMLKRPAIVIITAYGDPANRLTGKLQDVDDYLVKPFTPQDLRRVVDDLIHRDRTGGKPVEQS